MGSILDGRLVAERIRKSLSLDVCHLKGGGIIPSLAVLLIGENQASKRYVAMKEKVCEDIGVQCTIYRFSDQVSSLELTKQIHTLNSDPCIHGILIQLPLPPHIDKQSILQEVSPDKDVDGLTFVNMGALVANQPFLIPCTPLGCLTLLHEVCPDLSGKRALVIGRSELVGKPMAALLVNESATVTLAHSKTRDLKILCRESDIVISAVGSPLFLTEDFIKEGSIIIDVGINQGLDGKLVGDVNFKNVIKKAAWVTPVPGGVGPMTITMLLENLIKATRHT